MISSVRLGIRRGCNNPALKFLGPKFQRFCNAGVIMPTFKIYGAVLKLKFPDMVRVKDTGLKVLWPGLSPSCIRCPRPF